MEKIPVFRVKVDPSSLSATGVDKVSLVTSPAIERNFIALSKVDVKTIQEEGVKSLNAAKLAEMQSQTSTDELKGEVTGPILVPDFQIFRLDDNGNPYFIYFDAEDIEIIRNKYFKGGWQNNSNEQHEIPLAGNTMVESWIVQDSATDKSVALGIEVPVGTWMGTMKIEDKEYFQKEILSGNLKGFSIEGWFEYAEELQKKSNHVKPEKAKSNTVMKKTFFAKLSDLFKNEAENGESLASYTLEDAETKIIVIDETEQVFYLTDDNKLGDVVPDGEHVLSDGMTMVVADGMLSEIKASEEEEEEEVPAATTDAMEEMAKAVGSDKEALTKAAKDNGVMLAVKGQPFKFKRQELQEEQKLAVMTTTTGQAIWINQDNGEAWTIGPDLWRDEPLPEGSYELTDESNLIVVAKTEIMDQGTEWEMEITRSFVDFQNSTVDAAAIVPWLGGANLSKEGSEELATQVANLKKANGELKAANTEILKLKKENALLKKAPAAAPKETPAAATTELSVFGPSKKAQNLVATVKRVEETRNNS